jgi:hypothetical protein
VKVIIEIGRMGFLSPDAASAAKVMDLLGTMEPVETDYFYSDQPGQSRLVFFPVDHHTTAIAGAAKYQRFASREEFRAWVADQHKKGTLEGGAL